ncbi:MAG: tetratricopeptide repeat protein [Vampirovibrionales bacterium]|jgi:tetratricopeptide (TPR) repeat protein|nr:tetratricopeptide repeat protein [Vampirovibrionales bacterium]
MPKLVTLLTYSTLGLGAFFVGSSLILGILYFFAQQTLCRYLFDLAWILYQKQYYKTALFILEQTFKITPNYPSLVYTMGVIQLELGYLERAKDYLYIALLQNSEDSLCLYHLGVLEYQSERYTLAIDHWINAIQHQEEPEADTYYYLGLAYDALNESQAAYEIFQQGLELDPSHQDMMSSMAYTCLDLGNLDECQAYLDALMDLGDLTAESYYVMALLHVEAGEWEDALQAIEDALILEPHHVELLNTAGVLAILNEEADKELAISRLEEASKSYVKGQEAVLYNYAIALGVSENTVMARRILRSFTKLKVDGELRRSATQARLILQKQNVLNNM